MLIRSESFKLQQLRAKTDHQLAALLTTQLNSAADFLRMGMDTRAEKAYAEARMLLPWLDPADRRRLEKKFASLSGLLNQAARACS